MKADKQGRYRVNLYLNPDNIKDNMIIQYLNQKYSETDYIKEILYSLANGTEIPRVVSNIDFKEDINKKEEYEEIEELDDIEI